MREPQAWSIELNVRADATSMFIPVELLPDAVGGDLVTISSLEPATIRHGRIAELLDDPVRGRFFAVSLD